MSATFLFLFSDRPVNWQPAPRTISPPVSQSQKPVHIPVTFEPPQGSIFIPYWKIEALSEPVLPTLMKHASVKNLIYFGVKPDESGSLEQSEAGYTQLTLFAQKAGAFKGKKLLALRMIEEKTNDIILNDPALQDRLIQETLSIMQTFNFDGVVVDLEHSVLPTSGVAQSITAFLRKTAEKTHAADKTFAVTMYGDTFYRQRPYEVKKIASFSDEIMIMAYDFHKSYGEPGPNFPLFKGDEFAYDFAMMVDDFYAHVPPQKITVLFGLYGYDWSVDNQNRPLKPAKALTLRQIEKTVLGFCDMPNCIMTRDKNAYENSIAYNTGGQAHIVWYEDETSMKAKTGYLSTKGISSVGYWAFGYD